MTNTLHGFPVSPFVRSVRVTLQEKEISHDFRAIGFADLTTDAYAAINPFRKMPSWVGTDGFILYETVAILRYLDETGSGPALTPDTARQRAVMMKWIGIASSYLYSVGILQLFVHRVMQPMMGGTSDEAVVTAATAATAQHLDVLERELDGPYLAGDGISLADILVGSMLDMINLPQEGADLIAARPATQAMLRRLRERDSFRATFPEMLAGLQR